MRSFQNVRVWEYIMTNEVKDEVHLQEMNPIGLHSQLDYFISSINMQSNK